jgi:hypothetical protein
VGDDPIRRGGAGLGYHGTGKAVHERQILASLREARTSLPFCTGHYLMRALTQIPAQRYLVAPA